MIKMGFGQSRHTFQLLLVFVLTFKSVTSAPINGSCIFSDEKTICEAVSLSHLKSSACNSKCNSNYCSMTAKNSQLFMVTGDMIPYCKYDAISINNCSLKMIIDDAFKTHATHLKYLSLEHNNIKEVSSMNFRSITILKKLNLSYNALTTIGNTSYTHKFLLEFYINNNYIEQLSPTVFSLLQDLRMLNLASNNLTLLPTVIFRDLKKLETLELQDNAFKELHLDIFANLTNLTYLNLSNCRLSELQPITQSSETKLKILDLSKNVLENLPSSLFTPFNNLEWLDLSGNCLNILPKGIFTQLYALRNLSLSSNKLTHIEEGAFKNLTNLTNLQLDNNHLKTLEDGVFYSLHQLKNLTLSNNVIVALDLKIFFPLQNLNILDIGGNNLEFIDYKYILWYLPKLKIIYMDGNNWNCKFLIGMLFYYREKSLIYSKRLHQHNNASNIDEILCHEDNENEQQNVILKDPSIFPYSDFVSDDQNIQNLVLKSIIYSQRTNSTTLLKIWKKLLKY